MKKLFTLIAFVIATTFSLFAHDIIVLTDGASIRAKVMKSSSTEVEYFNIDIPQGPLFLLYADEIALVELNNGQTHYYSALNEEFTQMSYNQIFRLTPRNYYYEGQFYHRSEVENLLKNTCDIAYQEYRKGKTLNYIGWGLFAGGFLFDAAGIGLMTYGTWYTGSALLMLGSAATLASIPTIIIGQYKINNAYKKYNKQNLSLNIGINSNGLGVALQF